MKLYFDGKLFKGTEEEFLAIKEFEWKQWLKDGHLHRDGGPAIFWSEGSEFWYQNGRLHRIDGPAVIYADGFQEWYQNGKGDDPAMIYSRGEQLWYIEGEAFQKFFGRFFPMVHFVKDRFPGE